MFFNLCPVPRVRAEISGIWLLLLLFNSSASNLKFVETLIVVSVILVSELDLF